MKTACKYAEDTFADIRQRKVTLPLIFLFDTEEEIKKLDQDSQHIYKELKTHFSGEECSLNFYDNIDQHRIVKLLIKSLAMSKSKSLCAYLGKETQAILRDENTHAKGLTRMLDVADGNRFFKKLHDLEDMYS